MNLSVAVVTIVGVLLAVAGTLGIRAAWKVGQTGQTLTNYKEAAASWEATANALRRELADFKGASTAARDLQQHALDVATGTINELTVKVKVLEDTVSGRSAINDLATIVHADIESVRSDIHALGARLSK